MDRPKQVCGCCNRKKLKDEFREVVGYGNGTKYVCLDCAIWMQSEIKRLANESSKANGNDDNQRS